MAWRGFSGLSKTARKAIQHQARGAVNPSAPPGSLQGGEPAARASRSFPALSARVGDLNWIPVTSSNLAAVAYDEPFARMYVRFKSNNRYAYEDVTPAVFNGLLNASSHGKYLDRYIKKGGYAYAGPF